jgi:hypothetical protein
MKTTRVILHNAWAILLCACGACAGGTSGEPATARTTEPESSAPATAAPEAAAPVAGSTAPAGGGGQAVVTHDNYVIEVAPQGTATTNQQAEVDVRLVPRNGYHVNHDYPIKLQVAAPAGVTLARAEFDRAAASEFGEPRAVFPVRYTAASAGEKQFTADFNFSVCNPQTCMLERQHLTWSVTAQ